MPAVSVTPELSYLIDTEVFMSWKKKTKDKFHTISNEARENEGPTISKAIPESFSLVDY